MQEVRGDVSNRNGRRETLKKVYGGLALQYGPGGEEALVLLFLADAISAIPNSVKDRKDLQQLFKSAIRHENHTPFHDEL